MLTHYIRLHPRRPRGPHPIFSSIASYPCPVPCNTYLGTNNKSRKTLKRLTLPSLSLSLRQFSRNNLRLPTLYPPPLLPFFVHFPQRRSTNGIARRALAPDFWFLISLLVPNRLTECSLPCKYHITVLDRMVWMWFPRVSFFSTGEINASGVIVVVIPAQDFICTPFSQCFGRVRVLERDLNPNRVLWDVDLWNLVSNFADFWLSRMARERNKMAWERDTARNNERKTTASAAKGRRIRVGQWEAARQTPRDREHQLRWYRVLFFVLTVAKWVQLDGLVCI